MSTRSVLAGEQGTSPLEGFERFAEATLPTEHGVFRLAVYRLGTEEHMAAWMGDIRGEGVLCRVHSECWTGEVMGSLKCDCRAQLDLALERIAQEGRGVLVYLRQEGRGIGLGNKVRAYALQELGADTVEANVRLGLPVDARRYDIAAAILRDLGVRSVVLMTNNPRKIAGLEANGVVVDRRLSHWVPASLHSAHYLATKRERLGHLGVAQEEEPLLKSDPAGWSRRPQDVSHSPVLQMKKTDQPQVVERHKESPLGRGEERHHRK